MSYIEVINESKFYGDGATQLPQMIKCLFQLLKMNLQSLWESVAGKSTLLNILGGMTPQMKPNLY